MLEDMSLPDLVVTMVPCYCPFAITAHADHAWSHHALHLPFGCTYHSWFPMNWSQQFLGTMINSSFAQHLYTSIRRDNTATR